MKYIDMHCDTLTECAKLGLDLSVCNLQTDFKKLNASDCAAQCFAVFTEGEDEFASVPRYFDFYRQNCERHPNIVERIENYADLKAVLDGERTGCILTVENLGFLKGDLTGLEKLKNAGVRMASLVWNYENELAFPNLVFKDGFPLFGESEKRGLKPCGRQAAEELDRLKIIIDISHLSDGGADELLKDRKIPLVASHSNARSVLNVSRNLTDEQIKKIALCGGVIGVNFCSDFLGGENTFDGVLRHIRHIVNIGGEDVVAVGGDLDGIPAPPDFQDCTVMPKLFAYLADRGLPARLLEKLAYKNFERVFREVVG